MAKYSLVEEKTDENYTAGCDIESTRTEENDCGRDCRCSENYCAKVGKWLTNFCQDCCGVDLQQNESKDVTNKKYFLGFIEAILGINYCYWFQVIIHNKFCNFLFKCGCTWNWDGGWTNCNVHNTEGPRCPWCCARASISWTTDYMLTALMIVTYIFLLSKRKKHLIGHPFFRLVAPIVVYFTTGIIVGACFLTGGYPYFILWQRFLMRISLEVQSKKILYLSTLLTPANTFWRNSWVPHKQGWILTAVVKES